MESTEEKRARKRSHIITYCTVFIMSTGFSIVLGGVWPYMQELVPGITKDKLGPVIAATPVGTMIASPLMGLWGNKLGSIRIPCLCSVSFYIIGNVLYGLLSLFGNHAYIMMIVARLVVGVASANITLCRSYITSSTTLEERTVGLSCVTMAQALGFVIGPGIQAISSLIFPEVIGELPLKTFVLDMYTSAPLIAAALGIINCVLLAPGTGIFEEFYINEKAVNKKNHAAVKLPKPDPIALAAVLIGFFSTQFILCLIETIATPMVLDQYGWPKLYAVITIGIVISSGGMLLIIMSVVINFLVKRYDERKVMFIFGFIPMIIGSILFIPFTGEKTPIKTQCYNYTSVTNEKSTLATTAESSELMNPVKTFYNGEQFSLLDVDIPGKQYTNNDSLVKKINNTGFYCSDEYECACGCPAEEQPWCKDSKAVPIHLLLVAFLLVMFSFPSCAAITQSLYSKIIGPRPQGLWMGIITSVGSLARILGPLYVSHVYSIKGPYGAFGIVAAVLVISTIINLLVYKRLIAINIIEDYNRYEP